MTDAAQTSETPIWPALIAPVLTALSDDALLHRKEVMERAADIAELSPISRAETLSSGGLRYEQRMGWVLSNLMRAGLIDRPTRAHYSINDGGRQFLADHPDGMSYADARIFFRPYWPEAHGPSTPSPALPQAELDLDLDVLDPIEQIEDGISRNHSEVGQELLTRLRESHPDFFEQAVVDLLLKMGYGGAEQRGRRIGGTGDEGIDGVIDQDALGLDQVYVQAKRYKEGNNISRENIQAFVGALHGFGASRGVFITTSAFTSAAKTYSANVPSRVVLIDGRRLTSLMIQYNVGVQATRTYVTVEIDADYFD